MSEWKVVPPPEKWLRMWREQNPGVDAPTIYEKGDALRALVGREPWGMTRDDWRWHISLAGNGRVPDWDELVEAAHELRPGVPFVMGVPPKSWWMNVHPHVLHMWETKDHNLIEQWKINARGDRPT